MSRKPIPELPPNDPALNRAPSDDVPVEMEHPNTMPPAVRDEAHVIAAGQGGLLTPSQAASLEALARRVGPVATPESMPISLCPTNLDLTTARGKAMAFAAGSASDIEMDQHGKAYIDATHWIVFPERRNDEETGEMHVFARTVFIDASGRTFRTCAAHAPERMMALLWLYTREEWAKGIPLVITARPSRRKGRSDWHDIRVDLSRLPAG